MGGNRPVGVESGLCGHLSQVPGESGQTRAQAAPTPAGRLSNS